MFERIYVEIGNICNLNCSFCAGTKREKRQMTPEEFREIIKKIKPYTKSVYLHVMGEPLIHKNLGEIIEILREYSLSASITTNGTLLKEKGSLLISNADVIHKVSVSLHSAEGSGTEKFDDYLEDALSFSKKAAEVGVFMVFRLWNKDSAEGQGKNKENGKIEKFLRENFLSEWQVRPKGFRLDKKIFLEYDGIFTWPAKSSAEEKEEGFCHGLINQLAILVDGTVTPCCLDSEGEINLGNIFKRDLEEILSGDTAQKITLGFKAGNFTHPLCKKCTFARKFKPRNN